MTPEDKTLLLVEDDRPLRERLARAMEARGFTVFQAESVAEGKARAKAAPPAFAGVELKLVSNPRNRFGQLFVPAGTIRPESIPVKEALTNNTNQKQQF